MPSSPGERLRPELSVVINIMYVRKFLMENLPHYMQFPVEAVLVVIQKVWREEIRCRELDIISVTDCRDYLLKFAFEYFG
jgi:hypothetical protein